MAVTQMKAYNLFRPVGGKKVKTFPDYTADKDVAQSDARMLAAYLAAHQ